MKFYEIRAFSHGADLVEYDSGNPSEIEEALSRGVLLTTTNPVGGKEFLLQKTGSEYALTVTVPPAGPISPFLHETLEAALTQAELAKLTEQLEGT